uniref:Uncharacterized protein n=1 Tax=Candidatus Kentrum sp. TC TaxID=2126339 RepID=A0A450Z9K8_9GAMM|nr:MAG: hypothetical protein BECKTC1821D_GA0114238_11004 [Candidatus Kentron sp. TC]
MLGVTRFLFRASAIDMEIGDMPILDEITQCYHRGESFELGQALNGQGSGGLDSLLFSFQFGFIGYRIRFIGGRNSSTTGKIRERLGLPFAFTPILEDLSSTKGRPPSSRWKGNR